MFKVKLFLEDYKGHRIVFVEMLENTQNPRSGTQKTKP